MIQSKCRQREMMQRKVLSLLNKIRMKKSLTEDIMKKKTISSKSATEVEDLQEFPRYLNAFRVIESQQDEITVGRMPNFQG